MGTRQLVSIGRRDWPGLVAPGGCRLSPNVGAWDSTILLLIAHNGPSVVNTCLLPSPHPFKFVAVSLSRALSRDLPSSVLAQFSPPDVGSHHRSQRSIRGEHFAPLSHPFSFVAVYLSRVLSRDLPSSVLLNFPLSQRFIRGEHRSPPLHRFLARPPTHCPSLTAA